jgi:rod shape-determining protein MreB
MRRLNSVFADPDLAIDLGTATTRLCTARSAIAEVPSARADVRSAPVRAGVVVDSQQAAELLAPLIRAARRGGLFRPRALVCAPTDTSADEREALIEAIYTAGAGGVMLACEPLAAAIGAGLDVASERAHVLVDIGEGVTDMAVIRAGAVMSTHATRVGCANLADALRRWAGEATGIEVSRPAAAAFFRQWDFFTAPPPDRRFWLHCHDDAQRCLALMAGGISAATDGVIEHIVREIGDFLHDLPPELSCEVIESGLCLTGGGALLPGLAARIARHTDLDVSVAADPLHSVIHGARQMLTTANELNLWVE